MPSQHDRSSCARYVKHGGNNVKMKPRIRPFFIKEQTKEQKNAVFSNKSQHSDSEPDTATHHPDTRHTAMRNGLFRDAIKPLSSCRTGFSGTRKTPFRHTEEPLRHPDGGKTPLRQAPDNLAEGQYARSDTQKKGIRQDNNEMLFN